MEKKLNKLCDYRDSNPGGKGFKIHLGVHYAMEADGINR